MQVTLALLLSLSAWGTKKITWKDFEGVPRTAIQISANKKTPLKKKIVLIQKECSSCFGLLRELNKKGKQSQWSVISLKGSVRDVRKKLARLNWKEPAFKVESSDFEKLGILKITPQTFEFDESGQLIDYSVGWPN